jgi:sulfur-oxidizing protein SoxY
MFVSSVMRAEIAGSGGAGSRAQARPGAPEVAEGRRALLKRGGLLAVLAACGLLQSMPARAARDDAAFEATTMRDVLDRLGGDAVGDGRVVLTIDEIVENGAAVPVTVECRLAGVEEIFLVVEGNPTPVAVRFQIPAGTDAFVSTRLKLAQSGRVHALARAGGKLHVASRDTQVTVGACS